MFEEVEPNLYLRDGRRNSRRETRDRRQERRVATNYTKLVLTLHEYAVNMPTFTGLNTYRHYTTTPIV